MRDSMNSVWFIRMFAAYLMEFYTSAVGNTFKFPHILRKWLLHTLKCSIIDGLWIDEI